MKMTNDLSEIINLMGIDPRVSLGEGNFSRVFATNRNTVLKLTVDKAYMKFIEKSVEFDNPMMPEVINNFGCVAKFGLEGFELYAVELPRYLPLISEYNRTTLDNLFWNLRDLLRQYLNDGQDHYNLKVGLWETVADIENTLGINHYELIDALWWLKKNVYDEDVFFDTHMDNFMVTNEGQIIMNDPVGDEITCGFGFNGSASRKVKYKEILKNIESEKIKEISKLFDGKSNLRRMRAKFKFDVEHDKGINDLYEKSNFGKGTSLSPLKICVVNKSDGSLVVSKRERKSLKISISIDQSGLFKFDLGK